MPILNGNHSVIKIPYEYTFRWLFLCLLSPFYEICSLYYLLNWYMFFQDWRITVVWCVLTAVKSSQKHFREPSTVVSCVHQIFMEVWCYNRDTCLSLCPPVLAYCVSCRFLKTILFCIFVSLVPGALPSSTSDWKSHIYGPW